MATLFSKIIAGEIPCHKIAEDDRYFAFLDVNPLMPGHTLVVPKQETDYIFALDDEQLAGMSVFAKRVARAIEQAIPCKRIALAVIGLEVPHAHIHLVPIRHEGDLCFGKQRTPPSSEELSKVADRIRPFVQQAQEER